MQLVFATQNSNKAKEIQSLMPDGVEILSLSDIGCDDDIPETAETLEGNAILKAQYVHQKFKVNCFADDTGLEIDALNGEPGVYSARYAGPSRDANDNMDLVLQKLGTSSDRNAQFRTAICLIVDHEEFLFEGVVKGVITTEKRGKEGFGYDPVFQPETHSTTFAEMTLTEKNTVSHRKRAFEKMIDFLRQHQMQGE